MEGFGVGTFTSRAACPWQLDRTGFEAAVISDLSYDPASLNFVTGLHSEVDGVSKEKEDAIVSPQGDERGGRFSQDPWSIGNRILIEPARQ